MKIGAWIGRPEAATDDAPHARVVVSSRVRLARNLEDAAFPGWAGEEERVRIWTRLRETLEALPLLDDALCLGNEEMSDLERALLFERHLISREHARQGRGSGLALRADRQLAVMVNEEDHLRLQALSPGLDLRGAWDRVNALDDAIEAHVRYAFARDWGYLTACPTNLGTGMRASVMLHLPALALLDEMGPIGKGIRKIGLAVRGCGGEGTEAHGNLFQVSNQVTLGESEPALLDHLDQVVKELIEHEEDARGRLIEQRESLLRDQVGRAWGILGHAHILTSHEALDLLSALRLGAESGMIDAVDRRAVDALLVAVQPAHIQWHAGRRLTAVERDEARADLVRKRLHAGEPPPPDAKETKTA